MLFVLFREKTLLLLKEIIDVVNKALRHCAFVFLISDDIFGQPLLGSDPGDSEKPAFGDGETGNVVGHGPCVGCGPHHHHCHRHPAL